MSWNIKILIFNGVIQKDSLTRNEDVIDISQYIANNYFLDTTNNKHSTPNWLNKLSVSILNPINGSFYDGACGLGNTAFYSYSNCLKHGVNLKIQTQEINILISNVFILRAFLQDVKINQHICEDILYDSTISDKVEKFDYSIMFPPLGISNNSVSLYPKEVQRYFPNIDVSKITQEWCFALTQVAMLNENGTGLICVSNAALFNASGKDVRRALIKMNIIEAIIAFPSNSLSHTAVPVNFILFNKNRKSDSKILMLNAEALMDTNTISSNKRDLF